MINNTYVIDYTYSDLSEGEIAAHIAQMKAEAERELKQEARLKEKARAFRFSGDVLIGF